MSDNQENNNNENNNNQNNNNQKSNVAGIVTVLVLFFQMTLKIWRIMQYNK